MTIRCNACCPIIKALWRNVISWLLAFVLIASHPAARDSRFVFPLNNKFSTDQNAIICQVAATTGETYDRAFPFHLIERPTICKLICKRCGCVGAGDIFLPMKILIFRSLKYRWTEILLEVWLKGIENSEI